MAVVQERRQRNSRHSANYADVLVELTQLTYRNLLPVVLLGGAGLAGVTALLARHFSDFRLWFFFGLITALTLARVAAILAYSRRKRASLRLREAAGWQLFYSISTLVYCLTMAVCTLYNFRVHDSTAWTLCTLGCFMICAGIAARVAVNTLILQASGLILLGALAVSVLWATDPLARIGALLVCIFAVAFCQSVQTRFDSAVDQLRSRRTLRLLADHDSLTGLYNRRHFESILVTTCLLEDPFAILLIEINRLHAVNETYSRAVGDVLLQRVGVRLKNSVRRGDLVARLGGEQFAILQVEGASQASAESLARRIVRAIAAPFEIEGNQVRISVNVGIRLSRPTDADPRLILDRANYIPHHPPASEPQVELSTHSSQAM